MHNYLVNTHRESASTADTRKIYGAFHNKKYFRMRITYSIANDTHEKRISYKTLDSAINKAKSFITSLDMDVIDIMIHDNETGLVYWECSVIEVTK